MAREGVERPGATPEPFNFERKLLIILPTYNEQENLEAMVRGHSPSTSSVRSWSSTTTHRTEPVRSPTGIV